MGRKSRRKRMLAARRRGGSHTPNLLDVKGIAAKWKGGGCRHLNASGAVYGLAATVGCDDCGIRAVFKLRFGRPKWFDIVMFDMPNSMEGRPVGRASVQGVHEFLISNAAFVGMPDGGADPEGDCPNRDMVMLNILMETLWDRSTDGLLRERAMDFEAAWRGVNCDHRSVSCLLHGPMIETACSDCATRIQFMHLGGGKFHVGMGRMPLEPEPYGPHGADKVAGFLREFAGALSIPEPMADRMSHDPELDARSAADAVSAFMKCGLLRRAGPPENNFASIIRDVSAAACDRSGFERQVQPMAAGMRDGGTECFDGERPISAREFMEMMRLLWPFRLEGVGIGVKMYDPTGTSEYCARCGFDTLDDDGAEQEAWYDGCPECGYAGYLLGMD